MSEEIVTIEGNDDLVALLTEKASIEFKRNEAEVLLTQAKERLSFIQNNFDFLDKRNKELSQSITDYAKNAWSTVAPE